MCPPAGSSGGARLSSSSRQNAAPRFCEHSLILCSYHSCSRSKFEQFSIQIMDCRCNSAMVNGFRIHIYNHFCCPFLTKISQNLFQVHLKKHKALGGAGIVGISRPLMPACFSTPTMHTPGYLHTEAPPPPTRHHPAQPGRRDGARPGHSRARSCRGIDPSSQPRPRTAGMAHSDQRPALSGTGAGRHRTGGETASAQGRNYTCQSWCRHNAQIQ